MSFQHSVNKRLMTAEEWSALNMVMRRAEFVAIGDNEDYITYKTHLTVRELKLLNAFLAKLEAEGVLWEAFIAGLHYGDDWNDGIKEYPTSKEAFAAFLSLSNLL